MADSRINENSQMWMVRSGRGSMYLNYFLEYDIAAVGWGVGDLTNKTKDEVRNLMQEQYSHKSQATITRYANEALNFVNTIHIKDYIITPHRNKNTYYVGEITSNYYYKELFPKTHPTKNSKYYSHIRNVKWIGKFSKKLIEEENVSGLSKISTVYKINDDLKQNILKVVDEIP